MSGILNLLLGSAAGVIKDAYFNLVTLLLNTTATNGAQNNTFLDSSTNNFSITRNGNTTQGTFTPFSQTGWGNYFDGSGDYISMPSATSALALGSGDWTVECFVYVTDLSDNRTLIDIYDGNSSVRFIWRIKTSGLLAFQGSNGTDRTVTTTTVPTGTWTHLAICKASGTTRIFIGGVQGNTNYSDSNTYTNSGASAIGIISSDLSSSPYFGYISNFRVIKGTALYSANFTPPTSILTAVTNTSLLTCQSNRFVDNSTSALALTIGGNVTVQAFSPFAPTTAYDTTVIGGSGYFDGSGDYLNLASNAAFGFGTGNFTVEFWIYPTSSANDKSIYHGTITDSFVINTDSTGKFLVRQYGVADLFTAATALTVNAWNHIAVSRSGTTISGWLNGSRTAGFNGTNSTNWATTALYIGSTDTGIRTVSGYISGLRTVKGTAVYDPTQSTITIPTLPPTAITNTSLLLNYTNAGIYDSAAKNDLETVGNAQVSTTQAKWGTTSMYFGASGTNKLYTTNIIPPQSGNFTLEMWIYPTSFVDFNTIFDSRTSDTDANGFVLGVNAAAKLYFYTNNAFALTATGTISANTWTHVALVRNGTGSGNIKIYINGTADATTATNTASFTRTSASIGDDWNTRSSLQYFGYADDIRISNFARYTANFTAPTAAFPLQ